MKLLIVRHGIAQERQEFLSKLKDDRLRPLTPEGMTKMQKNAKGLRQLVQSIDQLFTSPWLRAHQTAQILSQEFNVAAQDLDLLQGDASVEHCIVWLSESRFKETVALVGHNPYLELLIVRLCGLELSKLHLKKGGAALIEFDPSLPKESHLLWLKTPSDLRKSASI